MGGSQVKFNVTAIPANNTTIDSNSNNPRIPAFRAEQKFFEIQIELAAFGTMGIVGLLLNILIVIEIQKRFKSVPYILLQNIVIVDLLTPIVNGPFFIFGLLMHTLGHVFPMGCNIQGFFHTSLTTIFVNTVALVALSRCLAVLRPAVYHRIFVNKAIVRIILLALWSSSALVCVPPMNNWGAFKRYEGTCWLAWLPSLGSTIFYNVIVTSLPLITAVLLCIVGLVVMRKSNKVGAAGNHTGKTCDNLASDASPNTARVNSEVLHIASIQLLVYILLWVPLSVMNWLFLKDWRIVDFRIIITFLFLFFGRSVINPIIVLTVGSNIGKQFGILFTRCKCRGHTEGRVMEI